MKRSALLGGAALTLCAASQELPAQAQKPAMMSARPQTITLWSAANLRCEYLQNPLGIDATTPRLSWTIDAIGRGWVQSAYRIQVASSPALLSAGKPDLWDSGKVASNQTLNVRYAGKTLGSGVQCYWRVQIWNGAGKPSAFSAANTWQMGLLKKADWNAKWISAQTPRDTQVDGLLLPPPPYLRKSFQLSKPIKKATVYATARGVYELHVNGSKIGDQLLAPGWTDYSKRMEYQAYDVTPQLHQGANALGVVLGDGWYSGFVGFGGHRNHYGTSTSVMAQLVVEYRDGTKQVIGTDTSWKGGLGPITYSDMLQGEFYDARKANVPWDTTQFSAANWQNAVLAPPPSSPTIDVTAKLKALVQNDSLSVPVNVDLAGDPIYGVRKQMRVKYTIDGQVFTHTLDEQQTLQIPAAGEPKGTLVIQSGIFGALDRPAPADVAIVATYGPPVRVTQLMTPKKITQPKPGNFIYDMGQNMVGVVRLKVNAPAGTEVKLRFAEMLNPDGTAYTANLRTARATDTYICKGGGTEIWQPHFTFHGFRYVEVTGFPGTPKTDAITGLVIGSDIPKTGTFSSSSPLVNQLQSNIDWGQRGNFLSIPTDCPQRDERLGWMGDAQIFVRTATYNRDVAAFFEKWMHDVDDSQGEDGGFSDVSPRKVDDANGAPAWGDAGVIVPWTIYQSYGDKKIVNDHWPAMERWMNYITSVNPNGLWMQRRGNDFGDWLSIRADTPKDVLATAYYAYDASLMARMARATGRTADAAKYDALFNHIKDAFNTAFVKEDGTVKGNTQTSYVVALRFNLLPDALRPLAAQHLVDDIHAKNDHLSTGFVGVGYLSPTLTDTGHNDVAYKLLLNDTFPSWGYSIRQGATTIWERWDGWTEDKGFQDVGMNSFNHYSLGSVGEWMYGHVAGIATDPDYPGYERIIIRPNPGPGLTFANASYKSVHGLIVSNWKTDGDYLNMEVTIPANTTAQVWIPDSSADKIQENGKALKGTAGVKSISQKGSDTVLQVGSGTYKFTVPLP